VTGNVTKYKDVITDRDNLRDPVMNVRVWVKTRGHVVETHSDATGAFTLRGVPAGDHTVHADFAGDQEGSAKVSLRSSDDCDRVLITASDSGRIAGTLTSGDGRPIHDIELHAIPVDHDWTRHDLSGVWGATSGQDGAYEFKHMRSGQYIVGVNVFLPAHGENAVSSHVLPGSREA
jgi:hypothetical protein